MPRNRGNASTPRRQALRAIATGGGAAVTLAFLPESWTRPVVHAVLLPAHAQLSLEPPPIDIDFNVPCGALFGCQVGVGDAIEQIPVVNLSGSDITLTDVALSNPDHTLLAPALPLVIPGGDCRRLGVADSSVVCGQPVSEGIATLSFEGFSPYDVPLPIVMPGP
jgi:hypothetical protein